MKKRIFLATLMALAVITVSSAQNPDKILKHHFKAVGQKHLVKIHSIKATGYAESMGTEMPLTMSLKRPDKIRVEVHTQGMQIIQAADGETAWAVNPMMGSSEPIELTGKLAEGLKENADLDGQLWQYQEKGHQLSLAGEEDVDGKACYVLKLAKKTGDTDTYYMDKESYLIQKIETVTEMNGVPLELEVLQKNYQDVNGYMMPFTTEQRTGGETLITLVFEKVEPDVEMDDSIFSMPAGN